MVRNLFFILAFTALQLAGGQGVVVVQKQEDLSDGGVSMQKMYIEQDKVAIESKGADGDRAFAYLAGPGVLRMVDHGNRTYREMTEQEIEQLMGGLSKQMAAMQEQMKNMTPQQRAMMEKVMGGRMPGMPTAESVKTTYNRGDGSAEIGGHSCDWYEGMRQDKLVALVCAAEFSTFDLRPSDFAVFQRLAQFMTKLAPQMADQFEFGSEDWEQKGGFPGVPLEHKLFERGRPTQVMTIESVERGQSIDEAVYAAPAGYKQQKGFR